jgi:propionate CoA-transferase
VSKVIEARAAVDLVKDGMTLGLTGFIGFCLPEELLTHLEEKYIKEKSPAGLTLFFVAGMAGDGKTRGVNHFGHEGLLKKLYCGNNSLGPRFSDFITKNKFPAFMAPQGVLSHLMRAIAGGKPGLVTHVGLQTFCDPRVEGCAVNQKAKDAENDIVSLIEIKGKEYLFYHSLPIDICFIKGTTGDEFGNISLEQEAIQVEQLELAAATHNCGGIVVAQVNRLAQRGTIPAKQVIVPGMMVDYVVVGSPENSRQHYTDEQPYVPSWSGEIKIPLNAVSPMALDVRKICGRRGIFELKAGQVVNLGVGVPTTIPAVANEEGLSDLLLSIESGTIGGMPASGLATGASYNPEAIIRQSDMFDFYDGGGIDVAYLGMAEADRYGNVNVSKYGDRLTGPGGFINITQNAKKVCFMGTFTSGKSQIEIKDGKLKIVKDGGGIKFVNDVEQITFSGKYHQANPRQKVMFITERAVFELRPQGLMLTEIAPGVDLQKDVLDKMQFKPLIAENLPQMDQRIFVDKPMGIK